MTKKNLLWVIVLAVLLFIVYPTAFDKRADIFAATKWGADTLGLFMGYIALLVGINLFSKTEGRIRIGLLWFNIGMFIMGSSFFFGPIINHYNIINKDLVEGVHGLFMLGGMIGYILALYFFLRVGTEEILTKWSMSLYTIIFFLAISFYIPTMSVMRTQGNDIKYWAELLSWGLGGIMVVMAMRAFVYIGGRYRKVLSWLFVSVIIIDLSYPFGPISQPNTYWTGAEGGTVHHGIMALAIVFFLGTIVFLRRLETYIREVG